MACPYRHRHMGEWGGEWCQFPFRLLGWFLLLCSFNRSDVKVHPNRASLAARNGTKAVPLIPAHSTWIRVHDDASAPCLLGNSDGNSEGFGKQGVSQASAPKPTVNGQPGDADTTWLQALNSWESAKSAEHFFPKSVYDPRPSKSRVNGRQTSVLCPLEAPSAASDIPYPKSVGARRIPRTSP